MVTESASKKIICYSIFGSAICISDNLHIQKPPVAYSDHLGPQAMLWKNKTRANS